MFKRIDIEESQQIDGYSYENLDGMIECISLSNGSVVEILTEDGSGLHEIYTKDIPKLIIALQAAYDQLVKEGSV